MRQHKNNDSLWQMMSQAVVISTGRTTEHDQLQYLTTNGNIMYE